MGSFTEIVLSFDFKESTPNHVLAAFSALALPDRSSAGSRALPEPVVEPWELFSPDWRDMGLPEGHGDPFEHEPWLHNWAEWVSLSMGGTTTPHGLLVRSGLDRWNLDCRFSWKTDPTTASEALAWLAPHVDPHWRTRRLLVGYAHHEGAPRPHLFWVLDGRWELEDLNPDDEWMWG